jgi:hypothetical protein
MGMSLQEHAARAAEMVRLECPNMGFVLSLYEAPEGDQTVTVSNYARDTIATLLEHSAQHFREDLDDSRETSDNFRET